MAAASGSIKHMGPVGNKVGHESQHHEHSQFFSQMSVCFDHF